MQDLTLVGLSEDRTKLVLVSDAGEEFSLAADARLRAALRGDQARLGQLEIKMDSALRPRDIQARIRSGETPEAVAQAAQTTVDRIMGFAMPVLAERAHIAERAQRSSVRRKGGEGPARILGDAVAERLRDCNVDPDSVEWDAWRREDGRWTLVADFRSGDQGRHAEFIFDTPGRYVVPTDDEARWLVGEQVAPKPARQRPAGSGRRLSAVSFEEELPLGEDVIGMVSDRVEETDETVQVGAEETTVDLTRTVHEVRQTDPTAVTGDADWMATQASDRPAGAPAARRSDEAPAEGSGGGPTAPAEQARRADLPEQAPDGDQPEPADESEAAEKKPARKSGRKGRRAVPSWDEIMFGGGRSE